MPYPRICPRPITVVLIEPDEPSDSSPAMPLKRTFPSASVLTPSRFSSVAVGDRDVIVEVFNRVGSWAPQGFLSRQSLAHLLSPFSQFLTHSLLVSVQRK